MTLLKKAVTHQTISREERGRDKRSPASQLFGLHRVLKGRGRSLKRIKNLIIWVFFSIQRIAHSNFTKTRMTPDYCGTSLFGEDKRENRIRKKIS